MKSGGQLSGKYCKTAYPITHASQRNTPTLTSSKIATCNLLVIHYGSHCNSRCSPVDFWPACPPTHAAEIFFFAVLPLPSYLPEYPSLTFPRGTRGTWSWHIGTSVLAAGEEGTPGGCLALELVIVAFFFMSSCTLLAPHLAPATPRQPNGAAREMGNSATARVTSEHSNGTVQWAVGLKCVQL